MNATQSICRCHPGEIRDQRFAFLDSLIDAGWGSVPMYLIERAMERNGGVLPPAPEVCGLPGGTSDNSLASQA
jgi:hypothetical protein